MAAFAAMVWAPGYVLWRRVGRRRGFLLDVPLSLFLGAGALALLTVPFVVAGASFSLYRGALIWMVIIGLVTAWLRPPPRAARRPFRRRALALAAFALLASLALLASRSIGPNEDAFDHIGYIARVMDSGSLHPPEVLAPRLDTGTPIPNDPRKGMFHPVMAWLCYWAGVRADTGWIWLPFLLFPAAVFAFLSFCRRFVSRRWELALCLGLFLLSYGGIGFRFAGEIAYGQNLSVAWYWLIAALCLARRPRNDGGREDAAVGLLTAAGVCVHLGVVLHAVVLAATILAFGPALSPASRRRAGIVGAVALVVGAVRVAPALGSPANAVHDHVHGVLYLWDGVFVASPMEILRQYGMLFLGGLVLLPVAAWRGRRNTTARRQALFAVIPVLACFVPFLTGFLYERGSYMIFRSLLNIPVFAVVVVTVVAALAWGRRRGLPARVAAGVAVIVWSNAFLVPTLHSIAPGREPAGFLGPDSDLVRYVASLPGESVILSDPATSYALSAYTDHRFVAVQEQHGNPFDPDALDRLSAVRDVLSPFVPGSMVLDACERYGVDFVVCNGALPGYARGVFDVWRPRDYPETVAKLSAMAGRFRGVYQKDGVTVFLHDPAGTGEERWFPKRAPFEFNGPDMTLCPVPSPDGRFVVNGVQVTPKAALAGDTVAVTVRYRSDNAHAFDFPYTLHFRFDHESLEEGPGYPGEKTVRRARARWRGRARRFRIDHTPVDGRLGADLWPIGVEFYDRFVFTVPPGLELGTYRVEVAIEKNSILPNFYLSDLLYNRDHYSGVACATLDITNRAVR